MNPLFLMLAEIAAEPMEFVVAETTLLILATVGALAGGGAAISSARQQSKALKKQGDIQEAEAARTAQLQKDENRRFRARQKLSFLKNGVDVSGSVLDVLADTTKEGEDQASATLLRGAALRSKSRSDAANARAQGRASLIGGISTASSRAAPLFTTKT